MTDKLRAGDATREMWYELLSKAYAQGRLTAEEFEQRMDGIRKSVYYEDCWPFLEGFDIRLWRDAWHAQIEQGLRPDPGLLPDIAGKPAVRVGKNAPGFRAVTDPDKMIRILENRVMNWQVNAGLLAVLLISVFVLYIFAAVH